MLWLKKLSVNQNTKWSATGTEQEENHGVPIWAPAAQVPMFHGFDPPVSSGIWVANVEANCLLCVRFTPCSFQITQLNPVILIPHVSHVNGQLALGSHPHLLLLGIPLLEKLKRFFMYILTFPTLPWRLVLGERWVSTIKWWDRLELGTLCCSAAMLCTWANVSLSYKETIRD